MSNAIIVNTADAEVWRRHLRIAEDQRLTATMRTIAADDGIERAVVRVSSSWQPNVRYSVRCVRYVSPVDGIVVTVECDCLAGEHANLCKHAALALQTANYFPFETRRYVDPEIIQAGVNLLLGGRS